MKTNLINTMAIVVLVTSISVFAQAGDTKREASATIKCDTALQNDSNQEGSDPSVSMKLDQLQKEVQHLEATDKERQKEEQKASQERMKRLRQQNEEWEHALLGIYGG